jgi:hypothetical protein
MPSEEDQLSFQGKVSFIFGGIALLIIASGILEYVLKPREEPEDYDEYVDIEADNFSTE